MPSQKRWVKILYLVVAFKERLRAYRKDFDIVQLFMQIKVSTIPFMDGENCFWTSMEKRESNSMLMNLSK